jgi:PST family polysaccharide transporter
MSLRRKVIAGASWTVVERIGNLILRYAITIILARLLTPEDFGLVGMVYVFTGFAVMFSELGFSAALVQKEEIEERHLSSIFWINLVAGIIITLLFVGLAPLIAGFYRVSALIPIVIALSLNFAIGSLNDVQTAIFQRELQFRVLSLVNLISISLSGVISILLALLGFGVWSLVLQNLLLTIFQVFFLWILSDWTPKRVFDSQAVRELFGFSSNLLGFRVFNYFVRNADDLLIGRFVNAQNLGYYRQAYTLMLLPTRSITSSLGSVMFPALSRIQSDIKKVKSTMLLSQRMIGFISIPLMIGLFSVAEPFVIILLGEQWRPMIPILRILCLVGAIQPVDATVGWIYQSQGRTDLMFRWGVFSGIVTLISFFIGIRWGIQGVALAYLLRGYLVLWYPSIVIPGRLINMTFFEYFSNISGILGLTLIMGVAVYMVRIVRPSDWSMLMLLVTQVGLGVVVYGGLVLLFNLKAYRDLRDILMNRSLAELG